MQTPDGEKRLENVDSENIDKSLSFGEHISSKISIANRNLGLIFRTFTYMDKDMFLNLFKSLVRPHLEYAVLQLHVDIFSRAQRPVALFKLPALPFFLIS